MSELLGKDRKEILKDIIRKLHEGADPREVKSRFKDLLKTVTTVEIAQIEQELIQEGLPREEVHRLCQVHLAVFEETLEQEGRIELAPPGHPVYILMEEHRLMLELAAQLQELAKSIREAGKVGSEAEAELKRLAEQFTASESHYVREENVLFPYLEKHGITEPPAVMWMDHDAIRKAKKELRRLVEALPTMEFAPFTEKLEQVAQNLAALLRDHFHKENNVLFPLSVHVLTREEWDDAKAQFNELGYCPFTPAEAIGTIEEEVKAPTPTVAEGKIAFETGDLTVEEIKAIFNALPVDITFVDKNDTVRYFNQTKERIFPRARAVIGRKVQQCHPQKSIHIVNRIIEDFKAGRRDVAEFWIQYQGRFVHIRYFPVRNDEGEYLGVIEVTQDITGIRELQGEKRLLDEE